MAFKINVDYRAYNDIENALDYYFEKSPKAAQDFYKEIQFAYEILDVNPFFQMRYSDSRCLPLRIFPFIFHFTIMDKDKTVNIHALINTSRNPSKYWLSEKKRHN